MTEPAVADSSDLDALTLLEHDQSSIARLLQAYRGLCDQSGHAVAEKRTVAHRLHLELNVSTLSQQEILGPPLRAALVDPQLFRAQDASAWSIIAHISMGEPGQERFDVRLLALGSELLRHCEQDRRELRSRVSVLGMDLDSLGARMRRRQEALMAELDSPLGLW